MNELQGTLLVNSGHGRECSNYAGGITSAFITLFQSKHSIILEKVKLPAAIKSVLFCILDRINWRAVINSKISVLD